jgi:indoleamine 2,3-dioxygenase
MTRVQPDGSSGLLAHGQFGDAVKEELTHAGLAAKVEQVIASKNQQLMSALFRDYCFAVSGEFGRESSTAEVADSLLVAYLLEPVDQRFRATGSYGTGRNVLPASLAVPLTALANELGHFAFMEYASSYALQNYRRINSTSAPNKLGHLSEWETDNLAVIRAFEGKETSGGLERRELTGPPV